MKNKSEIIKENNYYPKVKILYDGRYKKKVIKGFKILK